MHIRTRSSTISGIRDPVTGGFRRGWRHGCGVCYTCCLPGEMDEWFKSHAWKACIGESLSGVRIPLSPPGHPKNPRKVNDLRGFLFGDSHFNYQISTAQHVGHHVKLRSPAERKTWSTAGVSHVGGAWRTSFSPIGVRICWRSIGRRSPERRAHNLQAPSIDIHSRLPGKIISEDRSD